MSHAAAYLKGRPTRNRLRKNQLANAGAVVIRFNVFRSVMGKKTQSEKKGIPQVTGRSAATSGPEEAVSEGAAKSSKIKNTARLPRKNSSPGKSEPLPAKRTSRAGEGAEPSDEEIRIRAYFIAERRLQLSLQGDEASDWIQARKQLLEEAGLDPAEGSPSESSRKARRT
ncbi:MAG: hypothetical protein ABI871_04275 [Chthoniobacterales bacterium]